MINAVQRAILSNIIEQPRDCAGVSVPVLKELITRVGAELSIVVAWSDAFYLLEKLSEEDGPAAPVFEECGDCQCLADAESFDFDAERCIACMGKQAAVQ